VKNRSYDALQELKLNPFGNEQDLFKFRMTASYYLCWFTLNRDVLFSSFPNNCNNHTLYDMKNRLIRFYSTHVSNNKKFACAELSFCPDICYAKGVYSISDARLEDLKKHEANPCVKFGDGTCELSSTENTDLSLLKNSQVNVSCKCSKGFRYSNQMKKCLEIDECLEPNTCGANSSKTCLNIIGSFICVCKSGFRFKQIELVNSLVQNYTEPNDEFTMRINMLDCVPDDTLFV
jgi:hypothetical protein